MNRIKKHRIKQEKATTSASQSHPKEEHDLAFFIHDRVELMHQVFSVLKSKELKSLAPECVRRLSIDDLQELCLEELLGISSKRLCAILDGAEPPSDTDSSSQSEQLETISLDSISSDEEILSQGSGKKKKHKHKHSKKKRRRKSKGTDEEPGETRASRAGLTVLELLELQARARAIRAQLHQEPARVAEPAAEPPSSDTDEVLIKEEPPEVVEISSDEEKPDISRLAQQIGAKSQTNQTETNKKADETQPVTKRINDLVITVPQSKPTRKIKLKRQKPTEAVTRDATNDKVVEKVVEVSKTDTNVIKTIATPAEKVSDGDVKNKSKKSKKKKKKVKEKEGSDEDEITIQLSDTEKMDLLEGLEAKNFDTVSSSDSDSSDDDHGNSEEQGIKENKGDTQNNNETSDKAENTKNNDATSKDHSGEKEVEKEEIRGYVSNDNEGTIEINDLPVVVDDVTSNTNEDQSSTRVDDNSEDQSNNSQIDDKLNEANSHVELEKSDKTTANAKDETNLKQVDAIDADKSGDNIDDAIEKSDDKPESSNLEQSDVIETGKIGDNIAQANEKGDGKPESSNMDKSDGEISDRESSEVEASDVQPEVVCISDDEGKKKKKKKKEKKSKKEKKKPGFREDLDENFYKEKQETSNAIEAIEDDDDVYEYLEISDDSSCYEVEGVSVLSKEPTAEEIEAFSARMDEIDLDREETIPTEIDMEKPNETDIENVSWKDRYLGSKKVKRVLTTSNILNAIRKKNRELKKKLEEAKKPEPEKEEKPETPLEDGTIEQYETLQGSTKYVDPVKEVDQEQNEKEGTAAKEGSNEQSENVTREMKKDAKMLLKMYKRLLKYNDVNKQKDPNRKKKKKQKKSKDKDKVA